MVQILKIYDLSMRNLAARLTYAVVVVFAVFCSSLFSSSKQYGLSRWVDGCHWLIMVENQTI